MQLPFHNVNYLNMDKDFGLHILQFLANIFPTCPFPADGAVFPTFKSATQEKKITFDWFSLKNVQ